MSNIACVGWKFCMMIGENELDAVRQAIPLSSKLAVDCGLGTKTSVSITAINFISSLLALYHHGCAIIEFLLSADKAAWVVIILSLMRLLTLSSIIHIQHSSRFYDF